MLGARIGSQSRPPARNYRGFDHQLMRGMPVAEWTAIKYIRTGAGQKGAFFHFTGIAVSGGRNREVIVHVEPPIITL
jgi:hypothetical protein